MAGQDRSYSGFRLSRCSFLFHGRSISRRRLAAFLLLVVAWTFRFPASSDSAGTPRSSIERAQERTDVRSLDPTTPVEAELGPGQSHVYRVTLTAGQYVRVAVEQKGVDVAAVLFEPDGTRLADIILPHTLQGTKVFIAVTQQSGEHRLEVRSQDKSAVPGRYVLRILDLREATEQDKTRVTVRKIVAEASSLRLQGTGESLNKAIEKLEQALPLIRSIGDRTGEAEAIGNIGAAYYSLERYQETIDQFNLALSIWRETGDRRGHAIAFSYIAAAQSRLGQWENVIESFKTALPIYQALGDRRAEGGTLGNIGVYYYLLGDTEKALEYFERALVIKREVGDQQGVAESLNAIGEVHYANNEPQRAIESYSQAISISRAVGHRLGEALELHNRAKAYVAAGDKQAALEELNRVVPLFRELGDRRGEALALGQFGDVYLGEGERQKALPYLKEALSVFRALGDRVNEARMLSHIAVVYRDLNQLSEARSYVESALDIVESLRARIPDEQLRSSYVATVEWQYELLIDILMRQRDGGDSEALNAKAIEISERARARSLLDLLAEARVQIRQGVDSPLLERERSIQQSLNTASEQQIRLFSQKHTPEQADALAKRITSLTSQLQEVKAQIRAASPRYAALTQPEPLSLKQIQDQVLDPETVLLEYKLGDVRSYLWSITGTTIKGYELPARKVIEEAGRRFYDAIRQNSQAKEVAQSASALSRMLLAPVAGQLATKRLAIVADGVLQYVPFAALTEPTTPTDERYQPLMVRHEIVSLPSASTLAVLRREKSGRALAPKLVAVLADPVFDTNDVRLRRSARENLIANKKPVDSFADRRLLRSVKEVTVGNGEWPLPRLLGTRREAAAILSFVPESKSKRALDFEANREAATLSDIGQYQIVHFASHGMLNSRHPELSGIVLSLVDEQGQTRNGFLRLHEIFDLQLQADLVVLSACQTGLGKEIRGEGLIGLTRGFMYAGAPRVVTSLWQVDDRATSELMQRFYGGMLRRNLTAAAALRAAQIEMWRQKDWQSPYYWAAFGLQGEWK